MRAIVTKPFPGVKDGEVYPRNILADEEIEGDLARTAVEAGNAVGYLDEGEELVTVRVELVPLPPQPNNPPSVAALGYAGAPELPIALAHPAPGSETVLPAAAADDAGASTIEGPNTPTGGKLDLAASDAVDEKAAEAAPENADASRLIEHGVAPADLERPDAASSIETPAEPAIETPIDEPEGETASTGRRRRS